MNHLFSLNTNPQSFPGKQKARFCSLSWRKHWPHCSVAEHVLNSGQVHSVRIGSCFVPRFTWTETLDRIIWVFAHWCPEGVKLNLSLGRRGVKNGSPSVEQKQTPLFLFRSLNFQRKLSSWSSSHQKRTGRRRRRRARTSLSPAPYGNAGGPVRSDVPPGCPSGLRM